MKTNFFKRIVLFVLTNLAVVVLLGVVFRLLGLERFLYARGVDLDLGRLLVFSAVIGFAGSLISLALSKTIAKWTTGARVVVTPSTEDEAWLLATVARLARGAGIAPPEVAIYDSPDPNAFATGARRNAALVAVSTGLLSSMTPDEIEAVLAHEVAHVANGDMVTMSLLQGVMNTFVIFVARVVGYFVDRVLLRNERGYGIGYWASVMVTELVFGLLATLIVMAFSRRREFRADAGAASLVGPAPMVDALRRLARWRDAEAELPKSLSALAIRSGERGGFTRLLMSHPPLEDRIAALTASR